MIKNSKMKALIKKLLQGGCTALYLSAEVGHSIIANILLACNADPNAENTVSIKVLPSDELL